MAELLNLTVLSPDEVILETGDVGKVRVLLRDDSWLSVFPGHAPLLAEIISCKLEYTVNDDVVGLLMSSGILKISENQVTIYLSKASQNEDMAIEREKVDRFDKLTRKLMHSLDAQYRTDHNTK